MRRLLVITTSLVLLAAGGAHAAEELDQRIEIEADVADSVVALTVPTAWELVSPDEGPGVPFAGTIESIFGMASCSVVGVPWPPNSTLDFMEEYYRSEDERDRWDTIDRVQTRSGEALRLAWWEEINGVTYRRASYYLHRSNAGSITQYVLLCHAPDIGTIVPDDDWLHIAETLEIIEVGP